MEDAWCSRTRVIAHLTHMLERTGFFVNSDESLQNPIFDIIARKDSTLLLIKALQNIDSFGETKAHIMRSISRMLEAVPLIIGDHSCNKRLEDGVVYLRYGINALTISTLMDFLYKEIPPFVYSAPGGYYATIDGEMMREMRTRQGISLGEMARMLGISTRTVKMYEEGMSASVDIAADIEDILGPEVIRPYDLLSIPSDVDDFPPGEKYMDEPLHREVYTIFYKRGFRYLPVSRCPFEALGRYDPDKLVTGIEHRVKYSFIKKRAYIMSTLGSITESHSVIIISKRERGTPPAIEGTPIIEKEELKDLGDASDIMDFIKERSSE